MPSWTFLLTAAFVAFTISRVVAFYRKLAEVQYLAGPRFILSVIALPSLLLPSSSWNAGVLFSWVGRYDLYQKYGLDVIGVVPLLYGPPLIFTRSVEVAKQVLAHKSDWEKTELLVDSLSLFGENLFSSYRDRWPRHRRIVGPGFNTKLYAQVWEESTRVYHDMINSEGWSSETFVTIPNVTLIASKIALYLIASCGFGISLTWKDTVGEKIRGMTLSECFEIAAGSVIIQAILPRWLFRLPFNPFLRVHEANLVLESILRRIIGRRRMDGPSPNAEANDKDVFSLLLSANDAEKDSKAALTEQELIANVFLLMLAGHETTSRALGSTLGLLACNPEAQKQAYEEIVSVVAEGKDPTFQDYDSLPYVLACLHEGMRIYPSVNGIPRETIEATVLSVPTKDGKTFDLPLPKKTQLSIDFVGTCYNERYYPSPSEFIPSRWLSPEIEQPITFSYGPRICVGRKFALTEAVCILTMILRDWKLEPILTVGQTLQDWRGYLDSRVRAEIGFGPVDFPMKMTRRKGLSGS